MALLLLYIFIATTLLIIISTLILRRPWMLWTLQDTTKPKGFADTTSLPEPAELVKSLTSALPDCIILPRDAAAFKRSMNMYWAQQECEVTPACVVRPGNVQQLSTAVILLKREYDMRKKQASDGKKEGLFAVRGGGHSPVPGAASVSRGVLIDLGLFCEVKVSKDESTVDIGAGAKWMDVSKILDEKSLAVVGGRNSAVGVGGLTLGGKHLLLLIVPLIFLFHAVASCLKLRT